MNKVLNVQLISKSGLFLVFVILVVTREFHLFTDPRFWAEEATVYFLYAFTHSLNEHLTNVSVGYYSIVNVLSTALASRLVPLENAPIVTTISAFVVQLIPAFIIIFGNIKSFSDLRIKILALAVVLFVMPNKEVWLNVINSQFHFAIAAALILLHESRSIIEKLFYRMLLFFAGLTGLVSLFLFPLFLFKAITNNKRETYIQAGILCLAGSIQLYFIFTSGNSMREGAFEPSLLVFILLVKMIFLPLMGVEITNQVAVFLKEILHEPAFYAYGIILLTLAVFTALYKILRPMINSDSGYLILSSLTIFFFSVYGAMGDKINLLNTSGSGRYFYAPNTLIYLGVVAMLSPFGICQFSQKIIPEIIISLVILVGISAFWFDSGSDALRGPSWKKQIMTNDNDLRKIMIWPKGWFVNLNKMDNQLLENCDKNMFIDSKLLCLIYLDEKVKIKMLFKNNETVKDKYDLLSYKILENRNITKFPDEIIFRQVKNNQSNVYHDVQLDIMNGNELFTATIVAHETFNLE